MGDYETVISIISFIVISHIVLINGGGAEFLFDIPEDTEPPQLLPSETSIGFQEVDLELDAYRAENISFVEYSELSNPDYQIGYRGLENDSVVAVLENGTDSGELVYNTPSVRSVELLASKDCGFVWQSSRMTIVSEQPADTADHICGEVTSNVEENLDANFVVFNFLPSSQGGGEPQLYFFQWSEFNQNYEPGGGGLFGALVGTLDRVGDIVSYPARLYGYFSHFPFYIQIFYGAILAYMSIAIVRGI